MRGVYSFCLLCAALLISLAGTAAFARTIAWEQTYSDAIAEINISNPRGNVTITGSTRSGTRVLISSKGAPADAIRDALSMKDIDISVADGSLNIDVTADDNDWNWLWSLIGSTFSLKGNKNSTIDIAVELPIGKYQTDIETIAGDIAVSGFSGKANLSSVSGNIHAQGPLHIDLQSVSGDITARLPELQSKDEQGMESVSGTLYLAVANGKTPAISLETISGDIDAGSAKTLAAEEHDSEDLRIPATNKSTSATIALKTISGDITVRLPNDLPVLVEDSPALGKQPLPSKEESDYVSKDSDNRTEVLERAEHAEKDDSEKRPLWMIFSFVLALLFLLFIVPLLLLLRFLKRLKHGHSLSAEEGKRLNSLWEQAQRTEQRIGNLESILTPDNHRRNS